MPELLTFPSDAKIVMEVPRLIALEFWCFTEPACQQTLHLKKEHPTATCRVCGAVYVYRDGYVLKVR